LRSFSASDLLTVWERGLNSSPAERAMLLLHSAFPNAPSTALARLTLGQRDLCLIKLREVTFGSKLTGVAACPDCGEQVELDFDIRDIASDEIPLPDFQDDEASNEIPLTLPGWELRFRLPTNADLASLQADASQAKTMLLEACVLEASHEGKPAQTAELPEEVVAALSERMAKEDPYLNISLALKCPACGHEWQMLFDIAGYFMSEITFWAARMMREVHRLASVYGWREADILAMSACRRQRYLELIRGN
jgi:uncharacterized protein (UPF0212 family)